MRAERKICPKFVSKSTKKRSKKRPKIDSPKSRKNVKKRSRKVPPILTFPGRVSRALSGFYPVKKQNNCKRDLYKENKHKGKNHRMKYIHTDRHCSEAQHAPFGRKRPAGEFLSQKHGFGGAFLHRFFDFFEYLEQCKI